MKKTKLLSSNPWKIHGMGVATKVLWEKTVDEKRIEDIRLHLWSKRFVNPAISFGTGAIHWHSFDQISKVLRGRVKNTFIDYDNAFLTNEFLAIGDDVWNRWTYINDVPQLSGHGFVSDLDSDVEIYSQGDAYFMPAGLYHYFEPIDGDALTLVHRKFVDIPNYVLTHQKVAGRNPPINGRK